MPVPRFNRVGEAAVMYYFGSVYDLLSVSFSAENTTLLLVDICLRPKALRHFPSYLRFWPKVKFLLSTDLCLS